MSATENDGVTFVGVSCGITFAFLGVHIVGAVRERMPRAGQRAEWIFYLNGGTPRTRRSRPARAKQLASQARVG